MAEDKMDCWKILLVQDEVVAILPNAMYLKWPNDTHTHTHWPTTKLEKGMRMS